MYLHPTYAVTQQRVPLGVLNVQMWAREAKSAEGEKAREQPKASAKEKESVRWIKGYEHVAALAETMDTTRLVYVIDREGDIMELMVTARDKGHSADWLIRSQHNRVLPRRKKRNCGRPSRRKALSQRYVLHSSPGAKEARMTPEKRGR